jgi:hypothetical protein
MSSFQQMNSTKHHRSLESNSTNAQAVTTSSSDRLFSEATATTTSDTSSTAQNVSSADADAATSTTNEEGSDPTDEIGQRRTIMWRALLAQRPPHHRSQDMSAWIQKVIAISDPKRPPHQAANSLKSSNGNGFSETNSNSSSTGGNRRSTDTSSRSSDSMSFSDGDNSGSTDTSSRDYWMNWINRHEKTRKQNDFSSEDDLNDSSSDAD